jgi:uncharacterized membrane protein
VNNNHFEKEYQGSIEYINQKIRKHLHDFGSSIIQFFNRDSFRSEASKIQKELTVSQYVLLGILSLLLIYVLWNLHQLITPWSALFLVCFIAFVLYHRYISKKQYPESSSED